MGFFKRKTLEQKYKEEAARLLKILGKKYGEKDLIAAETSFSRYIAEVFFVEPRAIIDGFVIGPQWERTDVAKLEGADRVKRSVFEKIKKDPKKLEKIQKKFGKFYALFASLYGLPRYFETKFQGIKTKEKMVVLDIDPGTSGIGYIAGWGTLPHQLIMVDNSPFIVAALKRIIKLRNIKNVKLIQKDAAKLWLWRNSVDYAQIKLTLNYMSWDERIKTLKNIFHALKPGGLLYIMDKPILETPTNKKDWKEVPKEDALRNIVILQNVLRQIGFSFERITVKTDKRDDKEHVYYWDVMCTKK